MSARSVTRWPEHCRRLVWVLLVGMVGGCALPPSGPADAVPQQVRQCRAWYGALDEQVSKAGVRDAAAASVAGYPHLRVDRFTASLRDQLVTAGDAQQLAKIRAALMARLLALDLQARRFEIANLAPDARQMLAGSVGLSPSALMSHTSSCGASMLASDLAEIDRTDAMLAALSVPDDYVTAYRALGLYGLTRLPFLAGVRHFEASTQARFDGAAESAGARGRIQLAPPDRPAPHDVGAAQLRSMLRPPAEDPLRIPAPSPQQLATLFALYAPGFNIGVDSDDDLPGELAWTPVGPPRVDWHQPVVYRHTAYTRFDGDVLLQLVYTIWFDARTVTTQPIDLLAGPLDGLVWRVTLTPDGEPLVYDSIHPCGCYHLFFPGPLVRAKAPPDQHTEWAFSPRNVPGLSPQQHLVLRVAPATHYIEGLDLATSADRGAPYQWRDYDELRSLPAGGKLRRSIFNRDGFIDGTDRTESWLFWPMGIARAGTMRQWGRHATAFVGRRHFDDARLLEQRFAPVTSPDD